MVFRKVGRTHGAKCVRLWHTAPSVCGYGYVPLSHLGNVVRRIQTEPNFRKDKKKGHFFQRSRQINFNDSTKLHVNKPLVFRGLEYFPQKRSRTQFFQKKKNTQDRSHNQDGEHLLW